MSIVDGSTVKLSVSPGSCTKDQTIDAIPVSADGAISGQTLLLTPHTISMFINTTFHKTIRHTLFLMTETIMYLYLIWHYVCSLFVLSFSTFLKFVAQIVLRKQYSSAQFML